MSLRFGKGWPGLPRQAWPKLNKLVSYLDTALNLRSDGTLDVQQSTGAIHVAVPQDVTYKAVITGGMNPYNWRRVLDRADGVIDLYTDDDGASCGGNDTYRPAFERTGNPDVQPGSIVWLRPAFYDVDADTDQNFEFEYHESPPIVAQLEEPSSTCTLNGTITASATTLNVSSATTTMPPRTQFKIKIDQEIMLVTSGAAANAGWTVTRAQDGTDAVAHTNGATITLVGQWTWDEQQPIEGGLDLWESRSLRSGTQLSQPAIERNHNANVTAGTYVLLRKKWRNGAGASTLVSALAVDDVELEVVDQSTFPQTYPFYIQIDGEFICVTGTVLLAPDIYTVERGKYQSFATRHEADNDVVESICEWTFDHCCNDVKNTLCLEFETGLEFDVCQRGGGSGAAANALCLEFEAELEFVVCQRGFSLCLTFDADLEFAVCQTTGVKARKNSTGAVTGVHPRINFIEGANVTLTLADDAVNDEIDLTIASSGGSSGADRGCQAYHNTTQTVAAGATTALAFNTDAWDTAAFHDTAGDNTKILFNNASAGNAKYQIEYQIDGSISFTGSVPVQPTTIGAALRLNGGGGVVTGSYDGNSLYRLVFIEAYGATATTTLDVDRFFLSGVTEVDIATAASDYIQVILINGTAYTANISANISFTVRKVNTAGS